MTQTVRIGAKAAVAEGILAFELYPVSGGTLAPFTAGAHIDVHLADGLTRQYSLVNDESEDHRYVIAVQQEAGGRGGSIAMHRLAEGDTLAVGEPRNSFALVRDDVPTLLIAGGIGITPLLSMARVLTRDDRPFELHYAVRSQARAAFGEIVARELPSAAGVLYRDDDPSGARFDAARLAARAAQRARAYVCGPAGFMEAVSQAFATRPDIDLRLERFGAPAQPVTGDAFTVTLARRGIAVTVPPELTIVEALRAAGIEPEVSCEQGVCGTCLTTVLDGAIDHQDYFLSANERGAGDRILICVSRGKPGANLVLDI